MKCKVKTGCGAVMGERRPALSLLAIRQNVREADGGHAAMWSVHHPSWNLGRHVEVHYGGSRACSACFLQSVYMAL